jgi:hypothetical protein
MIFVQALLFGIFCILEVIISAKALQFPVGRDSYLIPGPASLPGIDIKKNRRDPSFLATMRYARIQYNYPLYVSGEIK